MPRFDVDAWFDVVEQRQPRGHVRRAGDGRAAHRQPALRRRRPVEPRDLLARQRARRPRHREAPAGQDAQRDGVQLVGHDRGRPGVLLHAGGGARQAHRLGRQADAADRVPHRRRGRRRAAAARHRRTHRAQPGPRARVLQRPRGHRQPPGATAGCTRATSPSSTRTASSTSSVAQKDVIIRGGNNIHATDVEAVLYEHPAVQEAAVAGIPHDVLGEDVGAWIVLVDGATRDRRRAHGVLRRAAQPTTRCPRRFTFVDELPRNATGKVVKKDLLGR